MNLEKNFRLYLTKTKGLAKRTVKNYLSDYRHFVGWLKKPQGKTCKVAGQASLKVEELGKINPNLLKRYRSYLSSSDLAKSTVKRRLSTIRIFCQFLLDQNLVKTDPSLGLENPLGVSPEEQKIDRLAIKFERYLKNQGASQNTIKNYLADIRGYLEWAIYK